MLYFLGAHRSSSWTNVADNKRRSDIVTGMVMSHYDPLRGMRTTNMLMRISRGNLLLYESIERIRYVRVSSVAGKQQGPNKKKSSMRSSSCDGPSCKKHRIFPK